MALRSLYQSRGRYVVRFLSRQITSSSVLSTSPKAAKHPKLQVFKPAQASQGQSGSKVVCLLVGWTGSSKKVVAKYAPIYTELGIPCVAVAPAVTDVWFTSWGNKLCEAAFKALEDVIEGQNSSLVIHIFSGAGYVIFPKFLESWSHSDSILRTRLVPKCTIFDSGPSDYSIQSGVAASKLMLNQGGFNLLAYYTAIAIGASTTFVIGRQKKELLRSALNSNFLDIPQLYLHSKADTVATFDWVERIKEEQCKKGRNISDCVWEDTPHLRLYVEHKDKYTRQIGSFLESHGVL